MSRSNYSDDLEPLVLGRWRGRVASAVRGQRGQQFFRDLIAALNAMPEKRLITGALQDDDGEVCAIGALGRARGIDMSKIDPESPEEDAQAFNIAACLAQEVAFHNDEYFDDWLVATPEGRWDAMYAWALRQLSKYRGK